MNTLFSRAVRISTVSIFAGFCLEGTTLVGQVRGPGVWQNQDIGAVGTAGGVTASGNAFNVRGSGADIWGSADSFQYVYQSWSGDGEIIVRLTSVENVDGWAKAGVMFRETLDPGSANVFLAMTPQNGTGFQSRTGTRGITTYTQASWVTPPSWLKIARLRNTFQVYQSVDGTNWTLVASPTIAMAQNLFMGLAVTSHHNGSVCIALFDNVSVTNIADVPAVPTGFTATTAGPDRISLTWNDISQNESGFEIQHSTDGTNFWQTFWGPVGANVTSSVDQNLSSGTLYYFRVRATGNNGPSPWSVLAVATTLKLPPPWQNLDIGTVGATGDSRFLFWDFGVSSEITGAGGDIGGTEDAFQYLYIPWRGDGAVTLHMWGMDAVNPQAKAAIMFRQSLDASAPNVGMMVMAGGATALQSRSVPAGPTQSQPGAALSSAWLKITRTNNTFVAYEAQYRYGYKETDWQYVGTVTVNLPDPIYLGVAVSSHQAGVLSKAYIYSLNPQGGTSSAVPPTISALTRQANGTIQFQIHGENGRSYEIQASTDLVNWTSLSTQLNTTGTVNATDTEAASYSHRFYRAVMLP